LRGCADGFIADVDAVDLNAGGTAKASTEEMEEKPFLVGSKPPPS